MSGWLTAAYPWVKALHIVSVIAWMAGLLYLPRLFVYHAGVPSGSQRAALLAVMERRLLRGIMVPALAMTYGFGVLLVATPGAADWRRGWLWTKLLLVVCLTVFQLLLGRWRKGFAAGAIPHTARFFRIINELPTLVMIEIVLLVVTKPF